VIRDINLINDMNQVEKIDRWLSGKKECIDNVNTLSVQPNLSDEEPSKPQDL